MPGRCEGRRLLGTTKASAQSGWKKSENKSNLGACCKDREETESSKRAGHNGSYLYSQYLRGCDRWESTMDKWEMNWESETGLLRVQGHPRVRSDTLSQKKR